VTSELVLLEATQIAKSALLFSGAPRTPTTKPTSTSVSRFTRPRQEFLPAILRNAHQGGASCCHQDLTIPRANPTLLPIATKYPTNAPAHFPPTKMYTQQIHYYNTAEHRKRKQDRTNQRCVSKTPRVCIDCDGNASIAALTSKGPLLTSRIA
jgi:hypothetical protein